MHLSQGCFFFLILIVTATYPHKRPLTELRVKNDTSLR